MSWIRHSRRTRHAAPAPAQNSLVMAISNNDRAWLRSLLSSGADTNAPHRDTLPLHLASRRGAFDIVDSLIVHGARINERDPAGHTALMLAAQNGEAPEIAALLIRGAASDTTDYDGNTALHHAMQALRFDHLHRLVRAGGNPDKANHAGITPRQLCAAEGQHAVDVLLQAEKEYAALQRDQAARLQNTVTLLRPPRIGRKPAGP